LRRFEVLSDFEASRILQEVGVKDYDFTGGSVVEQSKSAVLMLPGWPGFKSHFFNAFLTSGM
jgi:hypothetical protein